MPWKFQEHGAKTEWCPGSSRDAHPTRPPIVCTYTHYSPALSMARECMARECSFSEATRGHSISLCQRVQNPSVGLGAMVPALGFLSWLLGGSVPLPLFCPGVVTAGAVSVIIGDLTLSSLPVCQVTRLKFRWRGQVSVDSNASSVMSYFYA